MDLVTSSLNLPIIETPPNEKKSVEEKETGEERSLFSESATKLLMIKNLELQNRLFDPQI